MNRARLFQRIESALCADRYGKNCISAALFISGVRDREDSAVGIWDAYNYVKNLPIGGPQLGSILAFRSKPRDKSIPPHFVHMAVVVDTNPLRLVQRQKLHAPLSFIETPEDIAKLHADYPVFEPVYLNP